VERAENLYIVGLNLGFGNSPFELVDHKVSVNLGHILPVVLSMGRTHVQTLD
jgi:hypothetical protein